METSKKEWHVVIDGRSPLARIYSSLAVDLIQNPPQPGGIDQAAHVVVPFQAVSFGHPVILEARLKPDIGAGNLNIHTAWIPYAQILAVLEVSPKPASNQEESQAAQAP